MARIAGAKIPASSAGFEALIIVIAAGAVAAGGDLGRS